MTAAFNCSATFGCSHGQNMGTMGRPEMVGKLHCYGETRFEHQATFRSGFVGAGKQILLQSLFQTLRQVAQQNSNPILVRGKCFDLTEIQTEFAVAPTAIALTLFDGTQEITHYRSTHT